MKVNMLVKSIVYCKDIRVHGILLSGIEFHIDFEC